MRSRSRGSLGRQLKSVAGCHRLPARWHSARAQRNCRVGVPSRADVKEALGEAAPVRDGAMARLEALLLLAREPLGSRKLAQLAGLADGTKARTLVRALNSRYDSEGCAFRAEEVAGGFQLLTRPQFAPWLRRLDGEAVEVRLSAPAMETLAVVAYRQPVLRAEVEAVRGVQCGEMLRQLIERDLVRVTGRSDDLGRPLLYGTTRRFLRVFGLRHLDELPRPAAIPPATPQPCGDTISEDNPTNIPKTDSEESEVTTLTQSQCNSRWHEQEPQQQETEILKDPLRNDLGEDDDFDEDDFDDEDEEDYDEEEDDEDEEEGLDDDLDEEPWEEVEDEDDWEDDDLDDEDDDWEDDDWDED